MTTNGNERRALRPPCEVLFAGELAALQAADTGKMSVKAAMEALDRELVPVLAQ